MPFTNRGSSGSKPKPKAKPKNVKVSVPYAPTAKGKKAEREARGHVTVPYAPTPTGKAAEKAAQKTAQKHKAARAKARVRKETILRPGTEHISPIEAAANDVGHAASDWFSKAKEHAFDTPKIPGVQKGSAADTAISTAMLASTGEGSVAKALTATDVPTAEKAAQTAKNLLKEGGSRLKKAPARKVARVKSAPRRAVVKVKETPKRVKSAPRRAKKAVSTPEGRKAVAKGGAKKAARHPVRSGYGAAAVSPVPLPGELDKRTQAFAEGTYDATVGHPKEVAETTVHGVLGGLTAPLAIAGAGVESVKKGSAQPLVQEGKTLGGGLLKMGKNLASGDPKKVEETTIHESGLTPFIPLPHLLKRGKNTKLYEDARASVRGKVEGVRAKTRDERIAREKAAQEAGSFVPKKKVKGKVKHPVPDSQRPGENYVLRRTGKQIEKQRSRHRLSREVSRMEEEGMISGGIAGSRVMKALQKSKGANREAQNYGDAMRIFLKHGLPRDEAGGTALVQMLHDNWPKIEHGDVPIAGVHLDRHSTQFILDHPEIFKDKHFWKAIEAFDAESSRVGTSPRNQFLAQVHNVINPLLKKEGRHPILTPEEMITPEAVKLLPKRDKPWDRSETLDYVKELRPPKHGGADSLAKADAIEGALSGLMRPPKHGGAEHGVSTTQAVAWTPQMEKAFVKASRREVNHFKLREPSPYVADVVPSTLKGGESLPAYGSLHPVNKVWPSQGKAARSGNAESSLESLIYHSLEAPHSRKASVRGLKRIFDFSSRQVTGKRYLTQKQFEHALNTHQVPDGVIPVRTQMLSAMLEGDHPVDPVQFHAELMKEVEHGQKLIAGEQLAGEMAASKELGVKGEKFAPMDAVAIHELMGHMEGVNKYVRGFGHYGTNFATRMILNSPAFELAQFAQEGIPMAAALGRDVANVPKAIKNIAEISKLDPQTQAMIRATAGSSVGVLGAPSLRAWKSQGFMDPARAAGGKTAWQHAWEVVNGSKLGRFDRARAGLMRETAANARITGDLKRAEKGFRIWRSSANNLFKNMEQAVEDMKGMTPLERHAYVAAHPELGDRLMKSMSGMAGNWNSFTVFEKNIAPFTIFYPFQRYSVLWALYHFPLDHPVVATGLAMLGEVNAQELQKLAAKTGSTPSLLDYAKPVVNGHVLPAGQRFSAVLGSVQQAVLEGNPMEAIGSLSPALGIPLEAIAGKNAFTEAPLGESGWSYLAHQGIALSPLARFLGTKLDIPLVSQEKSPGSKLFSSQDPNRSERSFVNPYIGQSGKGFANEKRLERRFGEKYGEGNIPYYGDSPLFQKVLYGHNGGPNPNPKARKKEIADAVRQIHQAEGASNFIGHEEKPFFPPEAKIPKHVEEEIREAFENAWQTGPGAKKGKVKVKGGGIGGGAGGGIGGHPIGAPIGGSIGGSIGGHPIGGP